MTTPVDANALLMGGGKAAKFETIGATITGTVASEPTAKQQTDFRTGTPETWPDGSPKMQILVQIQTTEQDDAQDDGIRTLYIKGKELTGAVRTAVRASGARGIHTGGTLTVTYTGDGEQKERGLNPPKLYSAQYIPPAVSFQGVAGPGAAPAAPVSPAPVYQQPIYQAQPAQPVYQQPAQPAQIAAAAPAGAAGGSPIPMIDASTWARMTPDQQQRALAATQATQQAQAMGERAPF